MGSYNNNSLNGHYFPNEVGPSLLTRQGSVYSLTLEEFQSSLGDPGKNFSSMNMDELLKNIWTAEESQAMAAALGSSETPGGSGGGGVGVGLASQRSLQRQPSLTLPRTLSKKTVDEVWKIIHSNEGVAVTGGDPGIQQRQVTFGEMTLEEFLVKARVVREDTAAVATVPTSPPSPFDGFMGLSNYDSNRGSDKSSDSTVLNVEYGGKLANMADTGTGCGSLAPMPFASGMGKVMPHPTTMMEAMKFDGLPMNQQGSYLGNQLRGAGLAMAAANTQQQPATADAAAVYANAVARARNEGLLCPHEGLPSPVGGGGGGIGANLTTNSGLGLGGGSRLPGANCVGGGRMGSPQSPISDVTSLPMPSAMHYGPFPGRKRGTDGPLEKIIERRHKRMIKNRESAARSRARKQAYTVELEDEITHLKEENTMLRKKQEEDAEKRKKEILSVMHLMAQRNNAEEKTLRRTCTVPW